MPQFGRQHNLQSVPPRSGNQRQELGRRAEEVQTTRVREPVFERPPELRGDADVGQGAGQRHDRGLGVFRDRGPARGQKDVRRSFRRAADGRDRLPGRWLFYFRGRLHILTADFLQIRWRPQGEAETSAPYTELQLIPYYPSCRKPNSRHIDGRNSRLSYLPYDGAICLSCAIFAGMLALRRPACRRLSCRRQAPVPASAGPRRGRQCP